MKNLPERTETKKKSQEHRNAEKPNYVSHVKEKTPATISPKRKSKGILGKIRNEGRVWRDRGGG